VILEGQARASRKGRDPNAAARAFTVSHRTAKFCLLIELDELKMFRGSAKHLVRTNFVTRMMTRDLASVALSVV